ncbi:MAG TPA: hypothetical protein VLF21_02750 [Candidatus Saccharimonadales bacterium]|nr:hypothetical protein [Candidatus Saccharimonadales bacterium]
MIRRVLATAALLLVPSGTFADDAATLGPQTGASSTSSPQTLNLLQPANPSSLQPTGSSTQTGSSANDLQSSPADAAKLLVQGDGDGQQEVGSSWDLGWLWYLLLTCLAATTATASAVLWQRRRSSSPPLLSKKRPKKKTTKPKTRRKS